MEMQDLLEDMEAPLPEESNSEERTWGAIAHLGSFATTIVPFGNVLLPLILMLVKKDESPFIEAQAKEALNFQLSIMVVAIGCIPLIFIGIGILLLIGLAVLDFVACIIAAIKASEGKQFRYPLNFRWIK